MDEDARDERLKDRQGGRVYSVGEALRATFDAENHDTLGPDVTGLMIDLSKVPYEPGAVPAAAPAPLPSASTVRPSILLRIGGLFGRR